MSGFRVTRRDTLPWIADTIFREQLYHPSARILLGYLEEHPGAHIAPGDLRL